MSKLGERVPIPQTQVLGTYSFLNNRKINIKENKKGREAVKTKYDFTLAFLCCLHFTTLPERFLVIAMWWSCYLKPGVLIFLKFLPCYKQILVQGAHDLNHHHLLQVEKFTCCWQEPEANIDLICWRPSFLGKIVVCMDMTETIDGTAKYWEARIEIFIGTLLDCLVYIVLYKSCSISCFKICGVLVFVQEGLWEITRMPESHSTWFKANS